jgi:signal transduction histidine kinase
MTNRTILLVDDEEDLCEILSISLSDLGFQVHTATNGEHAFRLFQQTRPQIVLADIRMPGMDGIELLRKIKAENPNTEVIMITGQGDMDLAIKSLKYEATDFITKPIHDEVLAIALERARERLTMRESIREHHENLQRLVDEILGLSHTIKSIAGGIEGGKFVLEKGIELGHKEYLLKGWEMTKTSIDRIERLALDILRYARSADLQCSLCDPNLPAREVAEIVRPRAEQENIHLTIDLDPNLAPLCFDQDRINRCLLDLLTNAAESFPPDEDFGGRKQILLRTLKAEGCGVEYHVIDNGSGMDEETKKSIFQRFFTTKGEKGTGVGLMAARKTVEAHGGTLQVESEKGKGTTMRIRLPQSQDLSRSPS